MRKETARIVHSAVACILLLWSCLLVLRGLSAASERSRGRVSVCRARALALRSIDRELRAIGRSTAAVRDLRLRAALPQVSPVRHARLRAAASRLQRVVGGDACAVMTPDYTKYEFSLGGRYPTDGPLLYIFGVLGTRSRVAVEVDDASGAGTIAGGATLSVLHGWDVLSLHSAWSGSSFSQSLYADRPRLIGDRFPETTARVIESSTAPLDIVSSLSSRGVAGEFDLLLLFTEHGQEAAVLSQLRTVRPRVVVATYVDFLGPDPATVWRANASEAKKVRPRGGRDPLRPVPFAGASVKALVAGAKASGYRAVWCLTMFPVVVFVDEKIGAEKLLPTMGAGDCFARRYGDKSFEKDMAAMWDVAKGEQW